MENRENAKVSYSLKRELRGTLYREVLQYALGSCSEAVVVVRSHLSMGLGAKAFLERIQPYVTEREVNSPWVGAQLFDAQSQFIRFSFCSETLAILLDVSKKIYEWEQPFLPEDLSLMRRDGQDWLITMAHSRQAYLSLTREERLKILAEIPKLSAIL